MNRSAVSPLLDIDLVIVVIAANEQDHLTRPQGIQRDDNRFDVHLMRGRAARAIVVGHVQLDDKRTHLVRDELNELASTGAHDVLHKTTPFPELLADLEAVMTGGSNKIENRRQEVLGRARRVRENEERRLVPFDGLTPREQEVLGMLMDGMQAAVIAEESFVSLATVRSQIRAILTKLGVSSQLAAVSLAIRAGWRPGVPPS